MTLRKVAVASALLAASLSTQAAGFTLASPAIKPNSKLTEAQVFNSFGCTGKNISPALKWSGAPAGTKSYAVTRVRPRRADRLAVGGMGGLNIPASATELPEGVGADGKGLPAGAMQGRTDFGAPGFGGACPPKGDKPHRYIFTVHALKAEKIEVPADATAALVGFMINANRLGKATFQATYGR